MSDQLHPGQLFEAGKGKSAYRCRVIEDGDLVRLVILDKKGRPRGKPFMLGKSFLLHGSNWRAVK